MTGKDNVRHFSFYPQDVMVTLLPFTAGSVQRKFAISKIGISDAYFNFPAISAFLSLKCIINQCIEQFIPSLISLLSGSMLIKALNGKYPSLDGLK